MTLLSVKDLEVNLRSGPGEIPILRRLSFGIEPGETLGIVGESGSGKTMTALATMRMLPESMRVTAGGISFDGEDVLAMGAGRLRRLRGGDVGMVFQDPGTSLNPVMRIGTQIEEAVRTHERVSSREARARAIEMLRLVGLPDAEARISDYPHHLSGGMRQRAMIAMALCHRPRLLIADEPTTALDATVQAQILDLLARLNRELGVAMILISHNLGVVSRLCRRVLVMYAGRLVETAPAQSLFQAPRHPYTEALLTAIPRMDSDRAAPLRSISGQPPDPAETLPGCPFHPRCPVAVDRCRRDDPELLAVSGDESRRSACWVAQAGSPVASAPPPPVRQAAPETGGDPLLRVEGLVQRFPIRTGRIGLRSWLTALDGVDLSIARGESVGLVGESGSGKSTLARAVVMVQPPAAGSIRLDGRDITRRDAERGLRRRVQMVFQDPYASLNPSMTIGHAIGEPLRIHGLAAGSAVGSRVAELLETVGLPANAADRMPREFSGGQRQRVGIARALGVSPELLICDEPVSSLDVSLQAQIANLLRDLRRGLGLSYLLIAHDLPLVRYLTERVVVLYLGKVVETGLTTEVCDAPLHPYTTSLVSAIPDVRPGDAGRARILLQGDPPSLLTPPAGCRFHTRCPVAQEKCRTEAPPLVEKAPGRLVACHFPGSLS